MRKALLAATVASLLTAVLVAQAQVPGVNSTLESVFTLAYDNSTSKPTYSSTGNVAPAASATDVCVLIGSATKTIRVRRVILSGLADAVQSDPVLIAKRSTLPDGPGEIRTGVAYSTTFDAPTATLETFTANPTVGTLVGNLSDPYLQWGNKTTGLGSQLEIKFGELGSPVFLRGTAQSLVVNLNGNTFTTGELTCTFEWTEDTDS